MGGRVGVGGSGRGGCIRRNEVFVKIKKNRGGGGWGRARLDVNEEVKLL